MLPGPASGLLDAAGSVMEPRGQSWVVVWGTLVWASAGEEEGNVSEVHSR
jgi:hypothetical protein